MADRDSDGGDNSAKLYTVLHARSRYYERCLKYALKTCVYTSKVSNQKEDHDIT